MYSIISINGGLGKVVMSTAVVRAIKQQYPERKVIVLTYYPEVFVNNPNVYKTYRSGTTRYFYDDYIKDQDVLFFCHDPYNSNGYLQQDRHLNKAWFECLGLNNDNIRPELFVKKIELDTLSLNINKTKPILLLQPFGGARNKKYKYTWNRDIPPVQAQQIIDLHKDKFTVIQVCTKEQIKLKNCNYLQDTELRDLFCWVKLADKIIGIDSSVQHIASALDKPAIVGWITNKPEVFGYDIHKNVLSRPIPDYLKYKSALLEFDFSGNELSDYPWNDYNVFDVTQFNCI